MALTCTGGTISIDNNNRPECINGVWEDAPLDLIAIDQLRETLELLLVFDTEMFFIILGSLISAFLIGWTGGLIARVIMKTA